MAEQPRPRALWAFWLSLRILGWALTFGVCLLLGVILHADAPPLRGALTRAIQKTLAGRFRGEVVLDDIEHVGLSSAVLGGLHVRDEAGRAVLDLHGVRTRFEPFELLAGALGMSTEPLGLTHLRVDRAKVQLVIDSASGDWSLLRALASAKPPAAGPVRAGPPRLYRISSLEVGTLELDAEHPELGAIAARLQRLQGSVEVGDNESSIALERFGVQVDLAGKPLLNGTGSLRVLPKGFVAGTFHGFIDGTELDANGRFDNSVLTLRLDVPRALPERIRTRLPGWPLLEPLTAHAEAEGPPDALALSLSLGAGASRIAAKGTASLRGAPSAELDVRVEDLDARLFSAAAPATGVDAKGTVKLQVDAGKLGVTGEITTEPTQVGNVAVPSIRTEMHVDGGKFAAQLKAGDARGALGADLALGDDGALELVASLSAIQLEAWPELREHLRGRAKLELRARLSEGQLSARAEGQVSQFRGPAIELERAEFKASVSAPLAELADAPIRASLTLKQGRLGPLSFENGRLEVDGPVGKTRLRAELATRERARGTASATLELDPIPSLQGLELHWREPGLSLDARFARLSTNLDRVQVTELSLSGGVGRLKASGVYEPQRLEMDAEAEQLDIGALSRSLGLDTQRSRGLATGRLQLHATREAAHGTLALQLQNFSVQDAELGSVRIDANLAERQLEITLASSESPLGSVAARAALQIAGNPLALATWRRATGEGSVALTQLPLWPVGVVLARQSRIKGLDGHVGATLQIERSDPEALPSLLLEADTRGLTFRLRPEGAEESAETTFDRLGLHASASVDGSTGQGAATLLVTDEHGALLTTSGALEVDLRELERDPKPFLDKLIETPLDALLRLHPRPLSQMPAPFVVSDLAGSVEATIQVSGSLADPVIQVVMIGQQLRGNFADAARAVDVSGALTYTPVTGELSGQAEMSQGGTPLVNARLEGQLPNPLIYAQPLTETRLRAAAMLNGVPLDLWPAFARERVEASLYGSIDLEFSEGELRERAQLEIGDLKARGQALGNGRLSLNGRGGKISADLNLGSSTRYLQVKLSSVAAELADDAAASSAPALSGTLVAKDFSASSLSPLLSGILTRVDGDLDADLTFTLERRKDAGWYLGVNGRADVERTSAHVDLLGLEVRDLAARVSARSTPRYTVLLIEPLEAKVRSSRPNLRGNAELWLEGLKVTNGEAHLSLNEVPLSLEGAALGTARGEVLARLERLPDHMALQVKLPDFSVQLPASSTRSLIGLESNSDVVIARAEPEAAPVEQDLLLWKISLDLGDGVRLSRSDLDVQLSGVPMLEYRDAVAPSGDILAVPGGRVTLFDQSFTIDRGVISLVPDDADNPRLDITASWRSPDGTTVYVDITGTADDASITTRDDRGLEDVERFALLTGSGSASSSGPAFASDPNDTGALGQTFSLGINELLRDSVGNLAVSIGTTKDDRSSYSASVRLTDKLSFQGNYQSASETRSDRSTSDVSGTLDYRVSRHWSVRTELGTSGGAFDLLWSHRY